MAIISLKLPASSTSIRPITQRASETQKSIKKRPKNIPLHVKNTINIPTTYIME